jgi:SAM-dependent methyltransferase
LSSSTDQKYLREQQYRDDSNLRARMDLHRRFSTSPEPWHRWVFDRLDLPGDARVLEVGCGPAELWRANRDRIPEGWGITLADLSDGMLAAAHEWFGHRAEYVVADVQDLPFEDGAFDAAIANHMLYHVADRSRALGELARVLRRGGVLYAATNGEGHLREIRALAAQRELWNVDFRLENGAEQIGEHFTEVELELFPDSLEVTEVEPVLAFVRSFTDDLGGVEEAVTATIEREGTFHVTKASGLFRATGRAEGKPSSARR